MNFQSAQSQPTQYTKKCCIKQNSFSTFSYYSTTYEKAYPVFFAA